ncbi:MAG: DUF416 family protein [Chloroflexota bacterium]
MNFKQYEEKIITDIATLNHPERVAICSMCCNRLYPLYNTFHKIEQWGNLTLLAECRQMAKNWLSGSEVKPLDLRNKLEHVIPNTEDFSSVHGTYALNASTSHVYLLDLITQDNDILLVYVLHNCYSTIDLYVQELLDPMCKGGISEETIENHPAIIAEIN